MAPSPPSRQSRYITSGIAAKGKKTPAEARPSASILLISPRNEILLLHRVRTSSSFPSAHVFPGGNLSAWQDGAIPDAGDAERHVDGPAYRLGAIRECFEESGILLALRRDGNGTLLEVSEAERERAREAIHAGRLRFSDWVQSQGGTVDSDGLIPFTRWITPTNLPKRFTTQMYIYFLPLAELPSSPPNLSFSLTKEAVIPTPTPDGGIEHTAAVFAPLQTWLDQASRNEIILFPPQFYLMYLLASFLQVPQSSTPLSTEVLRRQRETIVELLKTDGDGSGVKWADKVISPTGLFLRKDDGRSVLALDKPGAELIDGGRSGDAARVVLVRFNKEGPRSLEVRMRRDVLEEERLETGDAKL
ncbi:MAG: hypothetical protein M1818_003625 [Claussenomyces sp. TS43310]|nr:MAG: hypothetical protein M1818_003625 [Claussenomyces sp. TS43310]